MVDELCLLKEEIRSLIDAPTLGERAPSRERLEKTLTTGYARALELEAERGRLERRIGEVALGGGAPSELARLAERASVAEEELTRLRRLLISLRHRVAAAQA